MQLKSASTIQWKKWNFSISKPIQLVCKDTIFLFVWIGDLPAVKISLNYNIFLSFLFSIFLSFSLPVLCSLFLFLFSSSPSLSFLSYFHCLVKQLRMFPLKTVICAERMEVEKKTQRGTTTRMFVFLLFKTWMEDWSKSLKGCLEGKEGINI